MGLRTLTSFRATAAAVVVVAVAGAVAIAVANRSSQSSPLGHGCEPVTAFDVGERYRGDRAVRTNICQPPAAPHAADAPVKSALTIYGTCVIPAAQTDGGCSPPVQIQTWPACQRNRSMYPPGGPPGGIRDLRVRGVPAARDGNGTFLELYTGASTVVIFAARGRQMGLARALRQVGAPPSAAKKPLPPPIAGAREGRLVCASR